MDKLTHEEWMLKEGYSRTELACTSCDIAITVWYDPADFIPTTKVAAECPRCHRRLEWTFPDNANLI